MSQVRRCCGGQEGRRRGALRGARGESSGGTPQQVRQDVCAARLCAEIKVKLPVLAVARNADNERLPIAVGPKAGNELFKWRVNPQSRSHATQKIKINQTIKINNKT